MALKTGRHFYEHTHALNGKLHCPYSCISCATVEGKVGLGEAPAEKHLAQARKAA